jgi:hypothetical protein
VHGGCSGLGHASDEEVWQRHGFSSLGLGEVRASGEL